MLVSLMGIMKNNNQHLFSYKPKVISESISLLIWRGVAKFARYERNLGMNILLYFFIRQNI